MAGTNGVDAFGDRVGQENSLDCELSHVLYHSRKYRSDRGVSRLEAVWNGRVAAVTGAFGGGDFYLGE